MLFTNYPTSAPRSIGRLTTSEFPSSRNARCKGVEFVLSEAFTSAPCLTNNLTTVLVPLGRSEMQRCRVIDVTCAHRSITLNQQNNNASPDQGLGKCRYIHLRLYGWGVVIVFVKIVGSDSVMRIRTNTTLYSTTIQ